MPDADRPIEEYALIGDCVTAALVNGDGGIDWLLSPGFRRAVVSRRDARSRKRRRLHHPPERAVSRRARLRLHDAPPDGQTRAPHRGGKRRALPMEMRVRARPNYGRDHATWTRTSAGGFTCGHAAFSTNTGANWHQHDLASEWKAERGQCQFAVLDYGQEQPVPDVAAVRRWLAVTETFWKHWSYFNHYSGRREDVVRRSAVTLKLLTHASAGAFIAATTTSLPEIIGGESNWDYRFAWVRDSSFYINTMFRLGYSGEATGFLNFVVRNSMASEAKGGAVRWESARPPSAPIFPPASTTSSFPPRAPAPSRPAATPTATPATDRSVAISSPARGISWLHRSSRASPRRAAGWTPP